mgnify:FL=1
MLWIAVADGQIENVHLRSLHKVDWMKRNILDVERVWLNRFASAEEGINCN